MLKKILAGVLGGFNFVNGLSMLIDGAHWFASTPGAASTGPFNSHLVADVGMAFIAAGLALAARSWHVRFWPAAVAGSAFLIFHALIHVVEFVVHPHDPLPMLAISISSVLALWAALPTQGERNAQRLCPQTD